MGNNSFEIKKLEWELEAEDLSCPQKELTQFQHLLKTKTEISLRKYLKTRQNLSKFHYDFLNYREAVYGTDKLNDAFKSFLKL
jgi:hypothetical protein